MCVCEPFVTATCAAVYEELPVVSLSYGESQSIDRQSCCSDSQQRRTGLVLQGLLPDEPCVVVC